MDAADFLSADVLTPANSAELTKLVAGRVQGDRSPLWTVGGATALPFPPPESGQGTLLSLQQMQRVIDYPARDMTITVEAGITLSELQSLLAGEHQRIPIDIPFPELATIGGAIATNVCGPSRFGHGTLRDYVIGIRGIDGHGRLFASGGRVVKNVAGYDLCKLLTGSWGTLAIITEVTLKLRPIADQQTLLWLTYDESHTVDHALERLLTSRVQPFAVELLNPAAATVILNAASTNLPTPPPLGHWVVVLGFEGTAAEIDWQCNAVLEDLSTTSPAAAVVLDAAASKALLQGLTTFSTGLSRTTAASTSPSNSWQFEWSVRPSQVVAIMERATTADLALIAHAADGIIRGGPPVPGGNETAPSWESLRKRLQRDGGNFQLTQRHSKHHLSITRSPISSGCHAIAAGIKQSLDPHQLLNRSLGSLAGPSS